MLISYLRVGISQKTVKEVDRINYEADYITGNDSVNKIRRGVELLALNKSGIKLPESFSAKVVNNAIEKENIDFKEAYKKKQKHVAARSDQQCTSFITCDFFTYCDPALVNTMIMEEFRVRLAALSTGAAVSGFGQVIVTGPSDIVGVAPGILNEAINFVSAVSGCDISVLNLMVTSDCVSSDGGGGTTPEIPCETACNDALNALQSGAEVVAEILPAEVIEAGSAFTKPKNPRWTALKNLTWRYESQEEGVVKLIDVSKDIWQWESLKHDKLVFVGTVSGGDVNVSSQTGTASFTPGTPNIQYAGMNLRFEIRYSTVCDCLPGKTNTVTIPYVSNAVFDANPKHDQ
ncbi:hypothetical protein FLA_3037 [Filimonas lacunae]|nr:hypothetical protein FLA_3037 [Filimonas lacunae]